MEITTRPCSFMRFVVLFVLTSPSVSATQHELICRHGQCTANTTARNGRIQCFDSNRVFHSFSNHCASIAHLNLVIYGYAWCPFFQQSRKLAKSLAANYNVKYRTNTTGEPDGQMDNNADMDRFRNEVLPWLKHSLGPAFSHASHGHHSSPLVYQMVQHEPRFIGGCDALVNFINTLPCCCKSDVVVVHGM